jgi:GNAT superfamily N-acetyltransferase
MEFIKLQTEADFKASFTKEHIAAFLHQHLDQYGDPVADIVNCIDYVEERGGFVGLALINHQIIGAVIINETGMGGYIPENILVYIAVDSKVRGKGVGKKLMEFALHEAKGDVALHVEASNPAKFLYEKFGFTNPYLEMRLKR